MQRNVLFCFLFSIICFFYPVSSVYAEDCAVSQNGTQFTLMNDCHFGESIDGLDAGTGASNSAALTIPAGKTLTVLDRGSSAQTLVIGSITLENGAKVIKPKGSTIIIGQPLCLTDSDGDGYVDDGTQSTVPFKSVLPATCVRKTTVHDRITEEGRQGGDCNVTDPSITTSCAATVNLTDGSYNRVINIATPSGYTIQNYYQEIGKDNGLVALWHMDEASGNVLDSSGNVNTGTPTGTTVVNGRIYKGRNFVSGNYITVADANMLSFPNRVMSVSAWVRTSSATVQMIVEKGAASNFEYTLRTNADGTLIFILYLADGSAGDSATSTTNIADGQWHHVAGVADNAFVYLYVDGKLEAKTALTRTLTNGTAPLYIGARIGSNYYFIGDMDEVALWNRTLAPEEITLLASLRPWGTYTSSVIDMGLNSGGTQLTWTYAGVGTRTYSSGSMTSDGGETPYDTTNLIGQWNFNSTSGTTATNDAGISSCGGTASNCNGTLTNFASTNSQDEAIGTGWTNVNKRWGAGGLMFDGTNDYVTIPDSPVLDFGNTMSVSVWANQTNLAVNKSIIARWTWRTDAVWAIQTDGNDGSRLRIFIAPTADDGGTVFAKTPVGSWSLGWHHVAVVYNGGQSTNVERLKVYIDGIPQVLDFGGTTIPTSLLNSASAIRIGDFQGLNRYWNGYIDAVQMYSRPLGTAEVVSLYNIGAIEMQWRAGSTTTPDSTEYATGTNWNQWAPVGTAGYEAQLDAMDSTQASWYWDVVSAGNADGTTATNMPKSKTQDTIYKQEGTGSLKLAIGQPQVDANTVGLWHLDETTGTGAYIKDSSGNTNHGTPTGTTITDGFFGKGRAITTGERINIPHSASLNLTNNFSLSAWVKFSAPGTGNVIASKYNASTTGWTFFRYSDNKFYMQGGNGSTWLGAFNCSTSGTWTDTAWHHVATTVGPSNVIIYVDGVVQATCALSAAAATNTIDVVLGGYNTTSSYRGVLDEVRISNAVRSAEYIAEEYRAGRGHQLTRIITSSDATNKTKLPFWVASDRLGTFADVTVGESAFVNYEPDANTLGLWHLEEHSGSGAYIKDSSSNGNNGTPTGTTFVEGKIGKARGFSGTSYVNLPYDSLRTTGAVTISAWIYPIAVPPTNYGIITQRTASSNTYLNYWLDFPTGSLRCLSGTGAGDILSIPFSTINQWTYVTCVRDPSANTLTLYVNGQVVAQDTSLTAVSYNASTIIRIGSFPENNYNFDGTIDEARIDGVARTASDIRQAYEIGLRTHPITIDFKAALSETVGSSTTSFGIDETAYGSSQKANHIFAGDTIILKENINGTDYMVQGRVDTVNTSTGALTVTWPSGQTWPTNFTTSATVFKWQREWMDLTGIPIGSGTGDAINAKDALTRLTFRLTDTSQGANIWLDDMRVGGPYLNTSPQSLSISPAKQYIQFRTLFSSSNSATSAALLSISAGSIKPSLTPTPTYVP